MISDALELCKSMRHEFVTPEHVMLSLLGFKPFSRAMVLADVDASALHDAVLTAVMNMERVPDDIDYVPEGSLQFGMMLKFAFQQAGSSDNDEVDIPHLVSAIMKLEESVAAYSLRKQLDGKLADFMSLLIEENESDGAFDDDDELQIEPWRGLVTCLNDNIDSRNPLIGRDEELDRTIQVLCRKDKNNPLHVGEPGVGKTALVYGLVARIAKGDVPERLKGCRVYQMDMATMLAGTQYRGDFEKRIKEVMDGIRREGKAIVYIDEIHNMVGAGRGSDGALDASNMLKPYLESGDIRFIGSTTYDEYNRYFAKSRGIVRRFQQIDIAEPSVDEAITILQGLKSKYARYHGVTFAPGVVEYAVRSAARYITDRFLPDKAIDLIDEAGAYRQTHPTDKKRQVVDKALMTEVLVRVCKVEAQAMKDDDNSKLATLRQDIVRSVFGQDEAVNQVVEAVQMAKAGLLDDDKPLASLLFVGPTGVGKTEVAKVLAARLGISLVRFDMSEYAEKHAVAKLIGSPAGYVGYEDGGLLTDAIRKSPNCVLLFDEIEKAHPDIYNILLQVMDYARLTDNRGRKADFRNVVVIMTSNAGAQFASQASVGFGRGVSRGDAMMTQVKRTFKPEFINRLTATVVFRDMDKPMAALILDKKLGELADKLRARRVEMTLTGAAREWLLQRGFTRIYGAREMDRAITHHLKPLFMREILFGRLRKGGRATVDTDGDTLTLKV